MNEPYTGDDIDPEEPPGPEKRTPTADSAAGAKGHSEGTEQDIPAPSGGKSKVVNCLTDFAPAGDYLRRIRAVSRGMTGAVVKEREGHYWRELATIRLDKTTGKLDVKAADGDASRYEPTALESAAIAAGVKGVQWPEVQPLHRVVDPPPLICDAASEDVFEFRDANDCIVMIQVRSTKDGKKSYRPLTFWTDQQWRQCEPDGLLPLWGMPQLKDTETVFLHEGAKAARAMVRMVAGATREDQERLGLHPWGRELTAAAHLGWIGGALAPHRTDWSVLGRGVSCVYVVADNDPPGQSAIPAISKALRAYSVVVRALRFDDRFPSGFDLADDFPAKMFEQSAKGHRAYNGPSFLDCLHPATWATRMSAAPQHQGRGRPPIPQPFLRPEFAREWWMVASEGKPIFINQHDRSKLYSAEAFDTAVRALSDSPRTSELFKVAAYASTVQAIAYEPGDEEGAITVEGERCINTWTAPRIQPTDGDPEPWLDFMRRLFPQQADCEAVMKWCATLIACPQVRMRYGLLLTSRTQGVGKTTLCEVLRVLVGEKNCRSPSVKDVVESAFNSWLVRKRLVFVNEIYEGKSWSAYQKMKSFITDQTLEANEKMVKGYSVRNWAHFVLCSNAEVPLWIEGEDRRFLVPEVTEEKRPKDYWAWLYGWLAAGGYGIVAHWAEHFLGNHEAVKPSDEAPTTARKEELIEDSRPSEERRVVRLADAAKIKSEQRGEQVILVEDDIADWLRSRTGRDFKPSTIRGWLKKAGLCVSKKRLKVDGRMTKVAGVLPVRDECGWPELKPYQSTPEELEKM